MSDTLTIDPSRTALLVMDYQAGIVNSVGDTDTALHHTIDAIALVRKAGGRVGYVRVAFTDEDIAAIPASSHFASVATPERREYLHADSPTTAIDERVAPESGDIIVRKTRVGAFSTTDLDQQLRAVGVDTLILAGLSTSGVVLSTVRDGADRDYRIIVLADACADPQPGVHEFLTEKVFPRQTQVTTTEELGKLLGAQD
ncbi:MAG TPA: cysteine hydrolase [Pseudonocardiaceae bacterium]|nr:cysteine hydrolase [Pseudonocardiaceae bacterium]